MTGFAVEVTVLVVRMGFADVDLWRRRREGGGLPDVLMRMVDGHWVVVWVSMGAISIYVVDMFVK